MNHLPLFFISHDYHSELLSSWLIFVNFWASVIAMAFLINWPYERNNRSVIACFLFNLSAGLTLAVITAKQFTKCIVTVILLLVAAAIVLADRKLFFENEPYPGPA